ncbi:MAG: Fe-S cluster assembly protein SufD [Candidatus Omnitrophica bacterium]|nr:Fe-S cluster assembly protein SufD [Candidatus Omnitrophota bacterium]
MIINKKPFIQDYDLYVQYLATREKNAALQELRRQGAELFSRVGLPSKSSEDWRYTDMQFLNDHKFNVCMSTPRTELENMREYCTNRKYYSHDDINIVFVNGMFSSEFSDYLNKSISGLEVLTLQEYLKQEDGIQLDILRRNPFDHHFPFGALNQAMLHDGTIIKIRKGATIEPIIHIIHVTTISQPLRKNHCCEFQLQANADKKQNRFKVCSCDELITSPRTIIVAEDHAKAKVLESHFSLIPDIEYFSNAVTDISLQPRSELQYYKSQNESLKAYHVGLTRVWQEEESNFDSFSFMTGSALARNNIDLVTNGPRTRTTLNALYSVNGKQHVDNHTSIDHRHPSAESYQFYKGILNGSSRAVFNGRIIVRSEAQKTKSYQLNNNLVAGKHCRVDTKPQLEIFANDVKCSHGATSGQLNPDEIFYLQTRAIQKRDAIKMLSHGFADEILNKIPLQAVREKLRIFLTPSLLTI